MTIRNDSKKIAQYLLDKVIECGDLNAQFALQYDELAIALGLESESYCRVCCQYLNRSGYIDIVSKDRGSKVKLFSIKAKAIDFLEAT